MDEITTIYTIVEDGHKKYPFSALILTAEARKLGKEPSEYGYFSDPGEASQEAKAHYGQDIEYVSNEAFWDTMIYKAQSDNPYLAYHEIGNKQTNQPPSFMPDILDKLVQAVKTAVDNTTDAMNVLEAPSERYISGITSTCSNCGYEETIEIPEQAEPQDIIQAMQAVRDKCPECEEKLRKLQEREG